MPSFQVAKGHNWRLDWEYDDRFSLPTAINHVCSLQDCFHKVLLPLHEHSSFLDYCEPLVNVIIMVSSVA